MATSSIFQSMSAGYRAGPTARAGTMRAMEDAQRSASQYDVMGASYAARNSVGAFNAYYERPATIELLGQVGGRRVLEAGCGAGQLTAWLVEHGAVVTAFDVSPVMAGLARERAAGRAQVMVADLGGPLSFAASGGFDLVGRSEEHTSE